MRGLFITGTDTGVGKTFVTAALAAELTRRGTKVGAVKPVESGCAPGPDGLIAADAEAISAAAGGWQPASARCLYRFAAPVAPGVAARREGITVDISECVGFVKAVAAHADVVLVEGAGGWRVPLDGRGRTIADLAVQLKLPVLVVARAGLGTINHTVLTVEVVGRSCELAAVVLSVRPEDDLSFAMSNADEIARLIRPANVHLVRGAGDVSDVVDRFTWNGRD